MGHKALFSILLTAIVFISAACAKTGAPDGEAAGEGARQDAENYIWEYLPLDQGDMIYMDVVLAAGWAAYQYSGTDAGGRAVNTIRLYSLIDKTVRDYSPSLEPGDYLTKYTLDEGGGMYAVLSSGSPGGEKGGQEYYLAFFDPGGKEQFRQNITGQLGADQLVSVSGIVIDGKGRIYISDSSHIWLYSSEGEYHGTVDFDKQSYTFFRLAGTDREGEIYAAGCSRAGYELVKIDFDRKKAGPVYNNLNIGSGICIFGPGIEKDFLVSDGTSLYEYDLRSKSLEKLFQWMDFDINGDNLLSLGFFSGIAAAAGKDNMSGEYFLARRTARSDTAAAEDPAGAASDSPREKQEIVLATLSLQNDRSLKDAVFRFNKASKDWHITIKEYGTPSGNLGERYERWTMDEWSAAVSRLNADLVSDNCPDIVDLKDINIEVLAQKGTFLDLGAYLDESDVLSREDYPANILDACTYQGRLLGIPKHFSVTSVMAHASDVGTEQGWTLEELIAYGTAHPGAELFEDAARSEIMNYCMSFYESFFVDMDKGECHFDSPEFKKLLEFARSFPHKKENAAGEFVSLPVKISNRDVLLDKTLLTRFGCLQYQDAVFENDGVWIGFPTPDKTPGHALLLSSVYAVTSRSSAAEGAWEFIEGYLLAESDFGALGAFPSRRQELQELVDSYLENERDSNGELVLDDDGQPIPLIRSGGTISYTDGWSYKYHRDTPEEIEEVLAILAAARRPDTFHGNGFIMLIISEEAEAFYNNQKSLDETVDIIQRRIQNYVDENK